MSPVAPNAGIIGTKNSDGRRRCGLRLGGTSKNSSSPKGRRRRNGENGMGVGGSGGVCGAGVYRAGGERTERGVVVPGRDVRLANCCNIWSLGPQTVLRFRLASSCLYGCFSKPQ